MSSLAANKAYITLNNTFKATLIKMLLFYFTSSIIFILIKQILNDWVIFQRLLPSSLVATMLFGGAANQLLIAFAAHIRSYRLEPFMWLNVISVITTTIAVVIFSHLFNIDGVILGIVTVQALFSLPIGYLIWRNAILK